MYITKLVIENFRNFKSETIEFNSLLNAVTGDNAQGKTSLIEAIYLSSLGKSFKTSKDIELIKIGNTYFKINIYFYKDNRNQEIELILLQNKAKQIKLNGVPLNKYSELMGVLNVVLFSPEDLKMVKGGPSERRKFIDREMSHLDKRYMDDLINYHKVLDQRNKLLKNSKENKSLLDTLQIWDEQLATYGANIIVKRLLYIKKLSKHVNKTHLYLSDHKENVVLKYESTVLEKNEPIYDTIKGGIKEKLINNKNRDIKYGFTSVGPHKDDVNIIIDDCDARKYASQGQQRTIALSIKLSEIELIYGELGEKPILLLDDVMSELDINRQHMLMKIAKDVQTILTTTDLKGLNYIEIDKFRHIEIKNGTLLSSREVKYVD